MTPLQSFGAAVLQERESQSMTVEALAGALNIWPKRMQAIEAGKVDVPFSVVARLANVLGCKFEIWPRE